LDTQHKFVNLKWLWDNNAEVEEVLVTVKMSRADKSKSGFVSCFVPMISLIFSHDLYPVNVWNTVSTIKFVSYITIIHRLCQLSSKFVYRRAYFFYVDVCALSLHAIIGTRKWNFTWEIPLYCAAMFLNQKHLGDYLTAKCIANYIASRTYHVVKQCVTVLLNILSVRPFLLTYKKILIFYFTWCVS
jgi:hypothetical protein